MVVACMSLSSKILYLCVHIFDFGYPSMPEVSFQVPLLLSCSALRGTWYVFFFSSSLTLAIPPQDMIACDVINPEDIDVTFNSIGGLELVKQSLHELVILPLQRPDLFQHGKLLRPQKGVLLYGPPGTGKTLLAKAIAKESQAVFINVRIATLMSKWFGDAQKLGMWFLPRLPLFSKACTVEVK